MCATPNLDLNSPIPAPIMGVGLANALTDAGLYHGTALYHLESGETVDATEFAKHRWGNPLLEAFGGLYVTFNYEGAKIYATNFRRYFLSYQTLDPDSVRAMIYTISPHADCEYALDEDYVGWEEYVSSGQIELLEQCYDYLPEEARQEVGWEVEKIRSREIHGGRVPISIAKSFYDNISIAYAPVVLERGLAPVGQKPTLRLLNDEWSILDATEVV